MNDTDSEYFFFGSADESLMQTDLIQYGLYEPITDRFVMVSKFKDTLKHVALLFSSRYQLYLCNLHTASNFHKNLIDNSCCYDWTISDKSGLQINESIGELTEKDTFSVREFKQAKVLPVHDLVNMDREYFMAVFNWISDCEYTTELNDAAPFYKSEIQMQKIISLPLQISVATRIFQQISDIIFTEYNFTIAEPKIKALLEELQ